MREVIFYTLMFSAMLQLLMAAYAWGRRHEPAARPLILVFVLGAVWAIGSGMDLASNDLHSKILWTQVYWTSASFGSLIFLLIVFEHLELTHLLTRGRLVILMIPAFTILALVWTMPYQNLLLYDFRIERIGSLDLLQKKNGVLFAPVMLASQAIALIAYYYLIRSLAYTTGVKRRQSLTILFALLTPFLANIPFFLGIGPIKGFDITPLALVISSGLFAFAIFGYRWLDILPLARTALVESIPVGVIVIDAKSRIVDINPSAKEFLQADDTIIGQESVTALAQFESIIQSRMDERSDKEIRVDLSTGQARYIDLHIMPLENQDGQFNGSILTLHDVTERKNANERLQTQLEEIESLHAQLHEQAIHDPLTGLFNRGYLNDTLEREANRAQRHQHSMSILMIEIDFFKRFNDTYGHAAGDVTLKQVAKLIQANTRIDDVACRFGGDEFTLIMPETPLDSALQCAERIRESASVLPLHYEGRPLGNLTLSIGVAMFPKHGESGASILRAADLAMYEAKKLGKNRVVVANN